MHPVSITEIFDPSNKYIQSARKRIFFKIQNLSCELLKQITFNALLAKECSTEVLSD
jgi:hypothetical protein